MAWTKISSWSRAKTFLWHEKRTFITRWHIAEGAETNYSKELDKKYYRISASGTFWHQCLFEASTRSSFLASHVSGYQKLYKEMWNMQFFSKLTIEGTSHYYQRLTPLGKTWHRPILSRWPMVCHSRGLFLQFLRNWKTQWTDISCYNNVYEETFC